MTNNGNRDVIVSCLRRDILRHIVTLKMLRAYGESMELRFVMEDGGWALLSLLPVRVSDFDRQAYPDAQLVVLVDGSSDALKEGLLAGLPPGRLVVKACDAPTRRFASESLGGTLVRSYLSYTPPPGAPAAPEPAGVEESRSLDPEVGRLLSMNGYTAPELERCFTAGARSFAVRDGARRVAAGFIFPNFDTVWEIGGLYTEPGHRRKGYARRIVAAALHRLQAERLLPRYQVRSDNLESVRLAESCGLREFLRMDHFMARKG
jgi:GNAT superfamily N-acetyltransferase